MLPITIASGFQNIAKRRNAHPIRGRSNCAILLWPCAEFFDGSTRKPYVLREFAFRIAQKLHRNGFACFSTRWINRGRSRKIAEVEEIDKLAAAAVGNVAQ